ncbi:GreA/GreB family elongation factor [Patescibacteria group bacterium]|nr:GreA/GreB family elongation factor [Patescibacteria group bacterium]
MSKIIFTKKGFEEVKKRHKELIDSRPFAVADLKKARDMGDLSENGYYRAAKFKLIDIDRNIRRFEYLIKNGTVADKPKKGTVSIGSRVMVKIKDVEKQYEIVGNYEANPAEGKISYISPIGKALMGKRDGDFIEILVPSGKTRQTICILD